MATPGFRAVKPIALVGLMGAGKTKVGERLAERLGLPFFDSDSEVERTSGLAVAEIFERDGEAAFRVRERDAVARLANGAACVIATGGGAFLDADSRRELLEKCLVVWLDAPVETLAARVAADRFRPLLQGRDPHAALAALAEQRRPFYAEAHVTISTVPPLGQVVENCLAALADPP
jgi:shikimate kinase